MKKLWVNWFLLFISMATAEKSNDTIGSLTGNELNCTTRECVKDNLEFELNMLNNMNASVDPCDNFYEFACGNFDNVPDDIVQGTKHNTFHRLKDKIPEMLHIIKKSNSSDSFRPFNFLRNFLISCERAKNNSHASHPGIKNDNLDYLKEIISKFGGWPVVEGDKWNETDDNWTNFIDEATSTEFIYHHFYELLTESIGNRTSIIFFPLSLEFSLKKKKNHQIVKMSRPYLEFMVDVANFLGANKTQAMKELAPLLTFEMKLRDISARNLASLFRNEDHSIELSVKEVVEKWPSIDWIKLLNTQSNLPRNFTNETVVVIKNTNTITKLENVVKNTTARVRANYAMWKTIQKLIPMVKFAPLSQLLQIYNKTKNPSYVDKPFICFDELKNNFRELMVAYYVRNYPIDRLTRSQARPFISYIKQKFLDTFNSTKWLDMKTRDTLFETINSLNFVIGYYDEIMDDKKLNEYFQGLNITQDSFLKNALNRQLFTDRKSLSLFNKPQDSIGFVDTFNEHTSIDLDSFFYVYTKTIVLGVELLRNLFFSIHRPNHINIAVLGSTLAHSIGHSIDMSYKDDFLSEVNNSKWSELSKQVYHDTRECIDQQYSNYSRKVTGKEMNSESYLDENIADIIGAKVAYSAYQDWVKTHGPQPTFSSLPYNSNQLFWLSFANPWCSPKSTLQNWRSTDKHPSSAHRVIIPLSNSPEFSKDFNCPLGSNMNPVKKCSVF